MKCSFGSGKPFDAAEEARQRRESEETFGWYEKPQTKLTVQGELRALAAKEAAKRRIVTSHSKERCPSCGNWKAKGVACKHCIRLVTRQQVGGKLG